MGANTQHRQELVETAIREISHIATLPEITLKIIELVEDPKSTAQDLHEVISNDPALCSRILKVVNSSFYGLPGQIGSINRAIVLLGLNAVKNIAIAASLAKLFRGGELTSTFSAKDLWTHSNATAAGCKMLSEQLKLGLGDEAYLAGLIHDIGLMVEMQFDRNKLTQVVDQCGADRDGVPCNDFMEIEVSVFGADHTDFGSLLCERWKFPASFAYATGYHHDPLALPSELRRIPALVYVADRIAANAAAGFRMDLLTTEYDLGVLDELNLSQEKLGEIQERFEAQLEELTELSGL